MSDPDEKGRVQVYDRLVVDEQLVSYAARHLLLYGVDAFGR